VVTFFELGFFGMVMISLVVDIFSRRSWWILSSYRFLVIRSKTLLHEEQLIYH
jgi:hypothetical protein